MLILEGGNLRMPPHHEVAPLDVRLGNQLPRFASGIRAGSGATADPNGISITRPWDGEWEFFRSDARDRIILNPQPIICHRDLRQRG